MRKQKQLFRLNLKNLVMNKVIVDRARLLRRVIIISWITLVLCFVVKIFGGNFFEIMCDNPNYKALCEYADSHFWLKYVIGVISSMFCQSLCCLAILGQYKFKWWQFILTFISICVSTYIKYYSNEIGLITDIWVMFGLPIVLLNKRWREYYKTIVAFILILVFQVVSLLTKNISITFIDETYFIGLIYMIDLYIMCLLYYLYANYNKENKTMGMLWVLFAGKPADKLKAMKEKREQKIAKLQAEINAIEIELTKRKNEK